MTYDIRKHFSLHRDDDGYSYIDIDDYELMDWLDDYLSVTHGLTYDGHSELEHGYRMYFSPEIPHNVIHEYLQALDPDTYLEYERKYLAARSAQNAAEDYAKYRMPYGRGRIAEQAAWSYLGKHTLYQWYGHVDFFGEYVIGQMFCLDAITGKPLWQGGPYRPNCITGVSNNIIVATETRSDGPWTANQGCYGILARTGELEWTSHGNGLWGKFLRLLDFIPGFTNELRDWPVLVSGDTVLSNSGRMLNIYNGKPRFEDGEKRHELEQQHHEQEQTLSLERRFNANSMIPLDQFGTSFISKSGPGLYFDTREPGEYDDPIYCWSDDYHKLWEFRPSGHGYHWQGGYLSYMRLAPPYLYLLVSEDKPYVPAGEHYVKPATTRYHLLVLTISNGKIIQDLALPDRGDQEYRIESLADPGILFSAGNRELFCYRYST